jgi:hypothetical protein
LDCSDHQTNKPPNKQTTKQTNNQPNEQNTHRRSKASMSTRELGQCTEEQVYDFLTHVFRKGKLPPENMVIALILMSRIVSLNSIRVNRCTWSVLTLHILFLSHKLMLDMDICNSWLSAIWTSCVNGATSAFSPAVVRKLEKYIMLLCDFNVYVSGAQYSQVYFEILALVPPAVSADVDTGAGVADWANSFGAETVRDHPDSLATMRRRRAESL